MKLDPNEMSFLDHLEDLRWHILRSFIAIFIVGIGAFIFKDFIFDKIILVLRILIFQLIRSYVQFQISLDLMIVFA